MAHHDETPQDAKQKEDSMPMPHDEVADHPALRSAAGRQPSAPPPPAPSEDAPAATPATAGGGWASPGDLAGWFTESKRKLAADEQPDAAADTSAPAHSSVGAPAGRADVPPGPPPAPSRVQSAEPIASPAEPSAPMPPAGPSAMAPPPPPPAPRVAERTEPAAAPPQLDPREPTDTQPFDISADIAAATREPTDPENAGTANTSSASDAVLKPPVVVGDQPDPAASATESLPAAAAGPTAAPSTRDGYGYPTPQEPEPTPAAASQTATYRQAPAVPQPRRRSAGRRFLMWILLAILTVGAALLATSVASANKMPRDVTIAGVKVGGMDRSKAVAALTQRLQAAPDNVTLAVAMPGAQGSKQQVKKVSLNTTKAGLQVGGKENIEQRAQRSVDSAIGPTIDLGRVWQLIVGGTTQPLLPETDEATLNPQVESAIGKLNQEATEGKIVFNADGPQQRSSRPGIKVDGDRAAQTVSSQWLSSGGQVFLPAQVVEPKITQAELDRAMPIAKQAANGPLTLNINGEKVQISSAALLPALSMVPGPDKSTLELAVDESIVLKAVSTATQGKIKQPVDARIELKNGKPTIVPSQDGVEVNDDGLSRAIKDALLSQERVATATVKLVQPKLTTQKAVALGVKEKVSTFSTPLTSSPIRTNNLRVAARSVNNTLVLPGEQFSLNAVLGKRTAAKGYGEAPMILGEDLKMSTGGGVSQMATTVFNNVFFSGLKDVRHTPHSFYISRYPEGREATVDYDSGVDLVWKNDSPYAVLVEANVTSTVNVSFWSTKIYEVKAEKSDRSNIKKPGLRYNPKKECVPQEATAGFTVTVTRIRSKNGAKVDSQSWRTVYQPEDKVVCGPKPSPNASLVPGVNPNDPLTQLLQPNSQTTKKPGRPRG